ncbi:glutaredoxin 3 [Paraglaciecola chathamensis]|jgi:glutaredoxin 3|uniref:Glutaredoxin n=2 Tax=Paraglaciecola chathamensis TaxID=368405 RepID=A0ABQ0I1B2_9ALTE|nr:MULTISPECIES: glutaredoxin 3 [Paraglaciecola]AEE24536.1 glutaredoxin 3 [Glaciecola sp. 4H-3-7+YE-5]MBN23877.1 glutaredoxin 3 [Alteromonadaceae bacterium]GAC03110.1 glutaredoxin 3 [Paraglaciecola agarilytica NO2]GAC08551.1 glutaredoxin 3 [Paraglaciecola chathamensis S18K6]|tara:strand:- start:62094 stop:62351 length:258 start_codon:yes stop_codon:yes gene_type:complete
MNTVEIYTKGHCPYCHRAKDLLEQKGVTYTEFKVDVQPELRPEMITRANGGSTVPQIFIGEQHVGGCDDLFALESQNKLDTLLSA